MAMGNAIRERNLISQKHVALPATSQLNGCRPDSHALDVTRRPVTAHEKVTARIRRKCATYPLRRRPDNLSIVADVFPLSRTADGREHARSEHLSFGQPVRNHRVYVERTSCSHPQVFASATSRLGRAVGKHVAEGQLQGILGRLGTKLSVPRQKRNTSRSPR